MKWQEKLLNADISLTNYARGKREKAILKIYYYGTKNGVRKVLDGFEGVIHEEFIDTKVEED